MNEALNRFKIAMDAALHALAEEVDIDAKADKCRDTMNYIEAMIYLMGDPENRRAMGQLENCDDKFTIKFDGSRFVFSCKNMRNYYDTSELDSRLPALTPIPAYKSYGDPMGLGELCATFVQVREAR